MAKKYSPEAYAAKVAAGGLTRRQEINRLEYTRALLDDPKVTWKQAQKRLDSSQITFLNQTARMKEAEKVKKSWGDVKSYKADQKRWRDMAKGKTPAQKAEIKIKQKQLQLKNLYGKDMLTPNQREKINEFLLNMEVSSEDLKKYWGY